MKDHQGRNFPPSRAVPTHDIFTVLIAAYNSAAYISITIESVIAQTDPDWELIIIDDGSTDSTLNLARRFENDERILIIRNPRNLGLIATHKHGISLAKGSIIGILDSDDALEPEALATVRRCFQQEPALGTVVSEMWLCDAELNRLYRTTDASQFPNCPALWMRGSPSFRCFRATAYTKSGGLNERAVFAEDTDLLVRLEEVAGFARIPDALYLARILTTSQSQKPINFSRARVSIGMIIFHAQWRRFVLRRAPCMPALAAKAWVVASIRYAFECNMAGAALRRFIQALLLPPIELGPFRTLARSLLLTLRRISESSSASRLYMQTRELQSNTGNRESDRIRCVPIVHPPGHAIFGGDIMIGQDGEYIMSFEVELFGLSKGAADITLEIYENLQKKTIVRSENISINGKHKRLGNAIALRYVAQRGERLEPRVYWHGVCHLSIYGITNTLSS